MLNKIDTFEQFEELLKKEDKFFLLKHSLTCPISHAAYQEYEKYARRRSKRTSLLFSCSRCSTIIELRLQRNLKLNTNHLKYFCLIMGRLLGMLHTGKLPTCIKNCK